MTSARWEKGEKMRIIDADKVMKLIPTEEYNSRIAIAYAPTVDAVEVKHGHWISASQTKFEKLFFPQRVFKCSVCHNYLDFDGVNAGRGDANYCPNCGAKMVLTAHEIEKE